MDSLYGNNAELNRKMNALVTEFKKETNTRFTSKYEAFILDRDTSYRTVACLALGVSLLNTKFPEFPAPFQKLNYPEIDYMREASPSSGEEKEEIPERYEITGYVQRSNPHRATGVTFDDMDMIEKAMASDELTEAEQEQARQTFQKLEGTNMERVLQASVLGSSDKLKRYMRLYVDKGEPHLLTGKNRDDILREFDIREHVPE